MKVLNYTQFRTNLKATLNVVVEDEETVIISRGEKLDAVLISLKKFSSMQDTLHLMSTKNNQDRLLRAIERDQNQQYEIHDLITE